ncbi:hypothetical protein GCM10007939_04200 [Amylibacter marinus]|uniref:TfoX C-terminal domain-containing protein n=1 Tax=Amylibacter marinus TaxID=1475483 RepID=A0ABQ5VRV4_9RHOB|nr:TfoX/Sxy family DNA transformation protein [Amylibacter marinus]GLQ34137.1 hypothetical protein GCM10007939_04200 [Amylibacter marinus]
MTDKPSAIRNLGPASDTFYGRAGIDTADKLREIGPDQAYLLALNAGGKAHFIGYYAMVMGLQGRPWNDCRGAEKAALKKRFEAIKAQIRPQNQDPFEEELNRLGVISRSADKP